MIRTAKIEKLVSHAGYRRWRVNLYIDGGFIVHYDRNTRARARELARHFKDTGMCPLN